MAKSNTVRVKDPETGKTVTIPACELAPGMFAAQEVDASGRIGETVWHEAGAIKQATEMRHPPLPELRPLFERFDRLFPWLRDPAESWESGFRCDCNYAHEVLLWAHAADVFEKLTAGLSLSEEKKQDVSKMIVACMNNDPEKVQYVVRPLTITKRRLGEIIVAFYSARDMDPNLKKGWDLWRSWEVAHPGEYPTGHLNEELSTILQSYIRRRLTAERS